MTRNMGRLLTTLLTWQLPVLGPLSKTYVIPVLLLQICLTPELKSCEYSSVISISLTHAQPMTNGRVGQTPECC